MSNKVNQLDNSKLIDASGVSSRLLARRPSTCTPQNTPFQRPQRSLHTKILHAMPIWVAIPPRTRDEMAFQQVLSPLVNATYGASTRAFGYAIWILTSQYWRLSG